MGMARWRVHLRGSVDYVAFLRALGINIRRVAKYKTAS
jgi:hypothetical protein